MSCLLLVESLVLGLLKSVLLATLKHLKMTGFFGEGALSQSDQAGGVLLLGNQLSIRPRA